MKMKVNKNDWLFLVVCLLLGILAEESFFRGIIGISYLVFITAFYAVFFMRYRLFPFSHQRFGYLVVICIWLLAAGYVLNENILFYILNIAAIPGLVIFHLVLVTSPKNFKWNQPAFILYIFSRIIAALKYNAAFTGAIGKLAKKDVADNRIIIWKKILIGVVISLPVLVVVLRLLMTADSQFALLVGDIPDLFRIVDAEGVFRFIVVVIAMSAFFGLMQVLYIKQVTVMKKQEWQAPLKLDTVISITVLVLINIVYILFTIVQFKYFFSGSLQGDYTYAEYARKGFFELLFVTLINLSITIVVLSLGDSGKNGIRIMRQVLLTILVLTSAVMLSSAFLRLSMYEDAYGFTFTRVLVHSFMIFLVVIFTYTLVKIWVEKLSLFHFYFITALIYYTAISIIDLDKMVVKENINRYEETGKIDAYYLGSLSSTGVLGLIQLYEQGENIPHLETILRNKQMDVQRENSTWQGYNFKREQASQKLKGLQFK
ncbi:DUF4153 domain-containing protein [Neobacillus cucumis]|uniref:DUF4173 domain-containing protein n=1 Tax=Neobacillus cucumis TaxID=1740721 RepID=A0A2N5HP57_9BACI|nr:DUF4173 domain-containing protein [Neobacillus cucumis]PLS07294.1 DUF4173 domain-containing protein [Neobacillus cucumis]